MVLRKRSDGVVVLDLPPNTLVGRSASGPVRSIPLSSISAPLSSTNPLPNGTPAPGTSQYAAHGDHVHGLPAAGGDSSGTLTALVNTQARGLRTSGGVTIPMGVLLEGQTPKVVGGVLVGVFLSLALHVSPSGSLIDIEGSSIAYRSVTSSAGTVA